MFQHRTTRRGGIAIVVAAALLLAGCGGDDDGDDTATSGDTTESAEAAADDGAEADDDAGDAGEDGAAAPSGGGAGTLTIGDETIVLDSARCFLQEQDAAAGGGKILFVAQGFGTNAAGDDVVIDVSRYDEDSQFTGDDILVDIGDPFGDDAVSLSAREDLGTVQVDGSDLSAEGLTFSDLDAGVDTPGSFEISC